MKNKFKIGIVLFSLIMLMLLAVFLISTNNVTAHAYGPSFDPNYYGAKYPDVAAVYGTDPEMLYKHYLEYGINEKRFQNLNEETLGITNSDNITPTMSTVVKKEPVIITPIEGYTTYIDVSIDNQIVTYFKDGEIIFQSDCVTGTANGKRDTPKGTFHIINKVPGKRLKGPTWNCWVNRWMKFTESSCGFHDASWRSSFGGEIYKKNGSHGCVNLPKDKAYELYELVSVNTTVIVH